MSASVLRERIETAGARVAVVGLGYVGVPLAVLVERAGFTVEGVDPYLRTVPQQLASLERFRWHQGYEVIRDCDVVVICVPTPLDENEEPDLRFLTDAVGRISADLGAEGARLPKLVVVESTSFPGTTSEVVLPGLKTTGLVLGADFFLAYAPERVDPGPSGKPKHALEDIPRVVGGVDRASGELAEAFYRRIGCGVHRVTSTEAAEMSKLLENVFRAVNIALVNEISLLCRRMGINIWEVVEAAATKPFGFMSFRPGPGMGGHCIPVDPVYLAWRARQHGFAAEFIELASRINREMPSHVVEWAVERLKGAGRDIEGSRVLVVGVAYKEDVPDTRESPALKVISLLRKRGAEVVYHDSFIESVEVDGAEFHSAPLTRELLESADCVLILTPHSDLDRDLIKSVEVPVVDVRNALGRSGS